MTCDEAEILLHALIDGELDAGHAREVEEHIAGCPHCTAQLAAYREMSKAMAGADLRYAAPPELRRRIEASLPRTEASLPRTRAPNRRSVLKGFAMGSAVSAIAATGLFAIVLRDDDQQRILSEVVSAHLRSLQAGHLTDVVSTDQHTVKPWFNGKLDVSPPVIDLTAQGFTLIGGRLDYVDARAIGAIVYRRRSHVINLFVAQTPSTERRAAKTETIQGFNIRRWSDRGLNYWAVSDLAADELAEFGEKFEAAMKGTGYELCGPRFADSEFHVPRFNRHCNIAQAISTSSFRRMRIESSGAGPESILPAGVMDSGLALRTPRNDDVLRHTFAISPRDAPEFCKYRLPFARPRAQCYPKRGAGNAGRSTRPQPCVQKVESTQASHHGHAGITRHSPRNGFNGLLRASPVTGLFCHRRRVKLSSTELDASVGASGPHDFAVRLKRLRLWRHPRPPHPAPRP